MMSKIIYIPAFILCCFFLNFCSAQTKIDSLKFRKEIPTQKNGEPDLAYRLAQQKARELKLDKLEKGFDSLQIRIWYNYASMRFRKLLIITKAKADWSAAIYSMTVDSNPSKQTETIVASNLSTEIPVVGWNVFIEKISALQIKTLPNMKDIPGLTDTLTDGITYSVEIATNKLYRFYSYHAPDQFQDKFPEAKNMVDILEMMDDELGVASGIK